MRTIGTPQKTSARPKTTASRRLECHRSDRADQAADADRRGHVADRLRPRIEDIERCDHDQHVQATANKRLRDDHADQEACSRRVHDRPKPGREGPARSRLRAGMQLDTALDSDPYEDAQPGAAPRTEREHETGVGDRDQQARDQRPDEGAGLSIVEVAPFAAISSSACARATARGPGAPAGSA